MLKAGVFANFKGATTLLLWGDSEGIASLFTGLDALRLGHSNEFAIEGPTDRVTIVRGEGSTLTREQNEWRWRCSRETVESAASLTEPLVDKAGHQFLDVRGLAEQVIIARDEYPADLR